MTIMNGKILYNMKTIICMFSTAARYHGLENPVEISVLSTGDVIVSDTQLISSVKEVLIITSLRQERSDNYQYTEHGSIPSSEGYRTPTGYHHIGRGNENMNYAHVQNWSDQERSRLDTRQSNGLGNDRAFNNPVYMEDLAGNGRVPNGDLRYGPLPTRPKGSDILVQENVTAMHDRETRALPKDNFGVLRKISDDSSKKHSAYEMKHLNDTSEYPRQQMIISGGAKQPSYSDVLF